MSKENKQKNPNTMNWFMKIIKSPWFGLLCIILTVPIYTIVAAFSNDWKWVISTIIVFAVLLLLMLFLSFLMKKEREDVMHDIIQKDGLLNDYLQKKIEEFNGHGSCLIDIQKECKKRIQQNFFKTMEEVEIYDITDILNFEREIKNGSIWIISDKLGVDVDNKEVFDTIIANLEYGTEYKYFHTKNNLDAISRIKRKIESKGIMDINNKVSFTQVSNRYDALLTITKDVIVLNPDEDNRSAFVCIYSDNNFDIAFYRMLNANEIELLCNIIRNNMLTNDISSESVDAFSKLQKKLDEITEGLELKVNMQSQYINKLNQNPEKLNKYAEDQRSGELEKPNYYVVLDSVANILLRERHKTRGEYKGEIWALSLCLSNEWNEEDEHEKKWLDRLLEMDKQGIKTRRLYVFNDETLGVNPFDCKGKILLDQLSIYCSKATVYKNTQSYAISKNDIDISHDTEFERGFFAMTLEDKRIFLIYDVAEEKINIVNELAGEIDYNNERKKNLRKKWEFYFEKATQLNKYLQEKSSEEAITYMGSCGFDV
jgi:hypothetical protein